MIILAKPTARPLTSRQCSGGEGRDRPELDLLKQLLGRIDGADGTAGALLTRFGGLGALLSADASELRRAGLEDDVVLDLKTVRELAVLLSRTEAARRPVIASWTALQDYVRIALAQCPREQFRVLYLDHRNCLLQDEWRAEGTVDHAPVYPREVVRRALELSASALVLVHNHPTRSKRSRWSTHKHAETLGKLGTFAIA